MGFINLIVVTKMGREVRKVPKNWKHPKKEDGNYQPMFEGSFKDDLQEWVNGVNLWLKNKHPDQLSGAAVDCQHYEDWAGGCPDSRCYMPEWLESEKTHYMMYETTSEGTPISPAFSSPEKLAKWLFDNKSSSFGNNTATYEQWLRVCSGGYAPSAVIQNGILKSGVEAL